MWGCVQVNLLLQDWGSFERLRIERKIQVFERKKPRHFHRQAKRFNVQFVHNVLRVPLFVFQIRVGYRCHPQQRCRPIFRVGLTSWRFLRDNPPRQNVGFGHLEIMSNNKGKSNKSVPQLNSSIHTCGFSRPKLRNVIFNEKVSICWLVLNSAHKSFLGSRTKFKRPSRIGLPKSLSVLSCSWTLWLSPPDGTIGLGLSSLRL